MEDSPQDPYEYEVDLRDYIKVIWDQKWLIAAAFVVAVVLAGVYSVTQPSIYSTDVTLLITPRVSEQIVQGGESSLASVSLPPVVYEKSAMAEDLIEKVIADLGLENNEGESVSVSSLRGRMAITVEEKDRESTQGGNVKVKIPVITMELKGQNPERLKQITNKWASLFQERVTELFASETARSYQFISQRFSDVKNELKELEQEKLDYTREHSLQVLKSEVSVLENKYRNFLATLESQQASLETETARLESLEESLNEEPKFLEPERSIPRENLWKLIQGIGSENGSDSEGASSVDKLEGFADFRITDQQINDVFVNLRQKKADTQANIASLKKEIDYLESRLSKFEKEIRTKQAKIDETELQLQRLDREISRLNSTYNTLSSNLEEARIANAEKEGSTRILEKAVAPERPRSKDTKQNVAVAGVLGLFIGVLLAFFRNYMQGYEETEKDEGGAEDES